MHAITHFFRPCLKMKSERAIELTEQAGFEFKHNEEKHCVEVASNGQERVLSLDGGGVRGVAALTILAKLEELTGQPTHESFDVIGGTSTGAILAVLLGLLKIPAKQCLQIYDDLSHKLFNERHCILTRVLFYTQKETSILGDLTNKILSEHLNLIDESGNQTGDPTKVKLSDFSPEHGFPRVFLVTYDATNKRTTVLRNYDIHARSNPKPSPCQEASFSLQSPNSHIPTGPFPGTDDFPLHEAVLASTAAPTYFQPVTYQNTTFIDGGVGCNNPSMLAIAELSALGISPGMLVSLGTGLKTPLAEQAKESVVGEITDMAMDSTDSQRTHIYVNNLCGLLKMKYSRFNPDGVGDFDLDDAQHYKIMKDKTERYCLLPDTARQLKATEALIRRMQP